MKFKKSFVVVISFCLNFLPQVLSENGEDIVNLYKCKDSDFPLGTVIPNVPSYAFGKMVTVSIIDKGTFPGCKSGEASIPSKLFVEPILPEEIIGDDDEIFKIEHEGNSISPTGVLNVADQNYYLDEYCVQNYTKLQDENGTEIGLTRLEIQYCPINCSESIYRCIKKCCPLGKSILTNKNGTDVVCQPSGNHTWTGFFYDENSWEKDSQASFKHRYHYFRNLIDCENDTKSNGSTVEYWFSRSLNEERSQISVRLLTDGQILYISEKRRWKPLKEVKEFCIDGFMTEIGAYSGLEGDQIVVVCTGTYNETECGQNQGLSKLYMICLFIGSVFYLATALVYGLLWNTQNNHGWTVFSLVLSQFFMCGFIGNAHKLGLDESPLLRLSILCQTNAIFAHYFLIATFTWLPIINYDLWSTFRSLKVRNDKDLKKFFIYSIIGWGVPFIVVAISVVLNFTYPERESMIPTPEYGDNICFVARWAQGIYIYYLLLISILIIVVLTFLTYWKIYGFHKEVAFARSSSTSKRDQKEFMLYMKLSVVLGTSWIFEGISWWLSTENCQHWVWNITDIYNLITAIMVFKIFACTMNNVNQMEQKYPLFKKLTSLFRSCGMCLKKLRGVKPIEDSVATSSTGVLSTGDSHAMKTHGSKRNTNGKQKKGFEKDNSSTNKD